MRNNSSGDPNEGAIRHAGWAMAGVLLAVFAACSVDVGHPSPNRSMERICMATSQETWIRQRGGEAGAWQTPTIAGGRIRIRKPPLLVWLNMAAWHDLDPDEARIEELTFRARLVTIFLVLISVAAVGWVGWMLAGPRGGLLTTTIAASMFAVIKYCHYATYDPHVMGWVSLCVACGVWAMQPIRHAQWRPRHLAGWLGAGLALGGAVMTKGPVALGYALLPLIWMVAVTHEDRRRNAAGMAAMLVVAVLVSSWWYWHVLSITGDAVAKLGLEYSAADQAQRRPIYQYLLIIAMVFPWTFWWAAGFVQPLISREWRRDRRLWLAWGWFVTSFAAIALWPMRNERYLVPVMPGAALLTATWLLALMERNPEPPVWVLRCWQGLWITLGIVCVLFPVFVLIEPTLLARGLLRRDFLAPIAWPIIVLATVGLAALAWYGWEAIARRRQFSACMALGLWVIVLAGIGYHGYNRTSSKAYDYEADADRLFETSRGMPLFHFVNESGDSPGLQQGFRIYSRRVIRALSLTRLRELVAAGTSFSVMAAADSADQDTLASLGLIPRIRVREARHVWILYQPPVPSAGTVKLDLGK